MNKNTNKLALKAGSWYVISNFLLKAVGIITTPIFTRMLSPESYGITNTYTSWLGIFTIVGTLDIYSCIQIARHDYEDEEIDSFVSSVLSVSTISLLLLYIIIKLLGDRALSLIDLPPALVDVMFLEILFSNAFTILQTKHKAYFKYKAFVAFSATISILSPIVAVVLISLQQSDLYYWKIIGNLIPKLIISFFIYLYIILKGKCFYNKQYWKYALAISIPLIPHHLSGNILNSFDKIMINRYVGAFETGLYSLAYSYSSILSVVWASFNQAWTPWFYEKMKKNKIDDIKEFTKPYLIAFSFIFLLMLFVGPEALKIFGPKEYWDGIWVIPPVLVGIYTQFLYSLYVNVEFYHKKTKYISIGTLIAAFINIVLNYFFIPIFGYVSAAYTTLIGYLVMYILHYYISSKWEKRDLYDNKFIFKWLILIVVITIVVSLVYEYIVVRYVLLFCMLSVIFIKYKNRIVVLYKRFKGE